MKAHLMGIAGSGMSGIALWMKHLGWDVTGCDRSAPGLDLLERNGIRCTAGHDPSHAVDAETVVYTAAIPPDHPELAAARRGGCSVLRRSEMLAALAGGYDTVAIAGAHGKTTTTALTGWALARAGRDPLVLAGGEVPGWTGGFRPGEGCAVIEADEYDRAFLRLPHLHAAVTSFDLEHLECYGGEEALRCAFEIFLEAALPGGGVVVPVEEASLARWAGRIGRSVLLAGEGGDFHCEPRGASGWGERYSCRGVEGFLGIPGLENLRNAATAHALLDLCGLSTGEAAAAMSDFPGARRRLERLGVRDGMLVVSDYAHHPREIESSIGALRRVAPGRIGVVFEPHLFSRTRDMHGGMGAALALADESAVLPVYPAREDPLEGVDELLVVSSAQRCGASCRPCAPGTIESVVASMDVGTIVFMGAGCSDGYARSFAEGGA